MPVPDPWPLIMKRFPSSEYALLAEVRDKAGHYASRAADGVAMNLWPSRGLHVSGIEVKSYRGDWLSELKKPAKAENIFKFCDYWWLIAAEENVVKPEEVPKTWGFMEVRKGKLKTIIEAPKLTPVPMDRHFVAALLKRATSGMIPSNTIEANVTSRLANKQSFAESQLKSIKDELRAVTEKIQKFEQLSGVRIDGWQREKIAQSVKLVMDGGIENIEEKLLLLQAQAYKIGSYIADVLKENTIKAPLPDGPDA